ncbi:NUDIX hydrolase [Marinobacter sp. NFXS9]|uniref:NUDIX hydrolase n=1 Tax=Marinobacter sp. NFXS9 TaxID=2818433 RepID=UPI0032DEBA52
MPHPRPAVIVILERDGAFLLVQRSNPPDNGLWGHAGGKLEWGESLEQAALRELKEETGLGARPLGRLPPLDVMTDGHHFVLCPVLCEDRGGEPVAGDDACATGWFTLAEMRAHPERFSRDVARVCEQARAWQSGNVLD